MIYKKRKIQFGVKLMSFLFLGIIFLLFYVYKNPILLYSNHPVVQLHEKYDPKENIRKVFFHDKKQIHIKGSIDCDTVKDYTIIYKIGLYKKKCTISIKDMKAPVFNIKNVTTDLVTKIKPSDFVTNVKDDSKVTFSFEKNPSKEKTQQVNIIATDFYGNTTKKQAVLIRKKDTVPPKIKKLHALVISKDTTHNYKKDFKVTDNYDKNPKIQIDSSKVDTSTPGTYKIYVTTIDHSQNSMKKAFKVRVIEAEKTVYLTFDDGPSENTDKILNILKKNKIHATFFVTGNNQSYNNSIKKAYKQGNTIGLHSYTHDYSSIYSSTEAYFADLNQLNDMIYSIIEKKSTFIRFPGGSSNMVSANYSVGIMSQLVDLVHEQGYEYFDWNCSSNDASKNSVDTKTIIENATNCDDDNVMILFHDSSPKTTTVKALQKIIDFYKNKGYCFKPITKNTPAFHHGTNN